MRFFKLLTIILTIICLFGATIFVKTAFAAHAYKAWDRVFTPGVGYGDVCGSVAQVGKFCIFPRDTNLPDETGKVHNLYTDNNVFVFRKPNDNRPWVHQQLTAVDGYHSWHRICPLNSTTGGFESWDCGPGPNSGGFSVSSRSSEVDRTTNNLVFIFYDSNNNPKVAQHISSYDGKSARARVCRYNTSNSGFYECTGFQTITPPALSASDGTTYDAYTDNYIIPVRKSGGGWEAIQGLISFDGKHSWSRVCSFNNNDGSMGCPGFTYFGVSPTLYDDHGNPFNRYTDNVNYYDSSVGGSPNSYQALVALPLCNSDSANPVCSGNNATQCTNGTKNCYYDLYEGYPNCIQPPATHPIATSATGCGSPDSCVNGSCVAPTPLPTSTPVPIPPTSTPTPTLIPTPTPIPVPFACDFNNNRLYDDSTVASDTTTDFSIWRRKFLNIQGVVSADCTGDGLSNLADFNKWYRRKYNL